MSGHARSSSSLQMPLFDHATKHATKCGAQLLDFFLHSHPRCNLSNDNHFRYLSVGHTAFIFNFLIHLHHTCLDVQPLQLGKHACLVFLPGFLTKKAQPNFFVLSLFINDRVVSCDWQTFAKKSLYRSGSVALGGTLERNTE